MVLKVHVQILNPELQWSGHTQILLSRKTHI